MVDQISKKEELNGKLFLIVGPSGSGKGSVISEIKRRYPGFVYPVSYTTRDKRDGEKNDQVYHFISKEDFKKRIANGEFLEYAIVHSDNYYGTDKKEIMEPLKGGAIVIREVDIQGFFSIKEQIPKENLVSIFMKVSDLNDLKGRILRRGEISEDELQKRMDSALKEISQADKCDYQVPNQWGQMKQSVHEVEKIILSEIKKINY